MLLVASKIVGMYHEGGGKRITMRIRTYRPGDIPALAQIQQSAARVDGLEVMDEAAFAQLVAQVASRYSDNIFLITDDDDEVNVWGQGETLEGIEGEVVGYTILYGYKDQRAYHFRSTGTVLPEYRQQGAGHALLLCAINHARIQALDISTDAHQQGLPMLFEVELPASDPVAEQLAGEFELELSDEKAQPGLRVYQTEL